MKVYAGKKSPVKNLSVKKLHDEKKEKPQED
jgi:hypothetical protein